METRKINDVMYVAISEIEVNPFQPRKIFDETEIEKLAESIKSYGVVQPVSLRRKNDRYELIIGERRLRASVKAGMTHIPAVIVDVDDEDSAAVALIENILRVDLNFIEEAESIRRLMDIHGLSQTELSKRLGMSQSSISNKIRVLALPEDVKAQISDHHLTERHGRALLRLDTDKDMNQVLKKVISDGLNVKKTEELVERKLLNGERKRRKDKRINFKSAINYKVYLNTIKQAYSAVSEANPSVSFEERETEDMIEVVIKIPKGH